MRRKWEKGSSKIVDFDPKKWYVPNDIKHKMSSLSVSITINDDEVYFCFETDGQTDVIPDAM